ncbi:cell surface protein [Bacillus anthracis]|uniref:Cell surface protein n=1 Tax=Bacillus anthracis TaxID=1392 RepID=A0A640MJ48_BACAN|nr:cell surface protein [Bacillus anthracis]
MQLKRYVLAIIGILGILVNVNVVQAADNNQSSGSSFVVSGNMPDNQLSDSGYFDLQVTPNAEQTLEVVVTNVTNQAIKVRMTLADATTSNNGSVNYQLNEDVERDSSLTTAFTDMASLEQSDYEIAANSAITVPVKLHVSKDDFKGVVLGGITATEIVEETTENSDTDKATTGVTNVFSYSIAAMLREHDEDIAPELVLNDVAAGQRNYRNYINANLQNTTPRIIKEMSVDATVYDSKGKVAYKASSDQLKMAPNSNFDYGISLEETKFIPGDYSIKMKVIADGVEFNFTKDFTIEATNANQLNKNAVLIDSNGVAWYIYCIIAVLSLTLVTWLIGSKRNINKRR